MAVILLAVCLVVEDEVAMIRRGANANAKYVERLKSIQEELLAVNVRMQYSIQIVSEVDIMVIHELVIVFIR